MWGLDKLRTGRIEECLVVPEEIDEVIRKNLGESAESAQRKIREILTWTGDHPWLPQEGKDSLFIEMMLRTNKYETKRTQTKLESYFKTLRDYPEVFTRLQGMKCSQEPGVVMGLPNLTPDYERLVLMRLSETALNAEDFDMNRVIRISAAMGLLALHSDKMVASRMIVDFQGCTFQHFLQVKINLAWKFMNIYENMMKVRISGIDFINAPSFISSVMGLGKIVLKPKLFSRIAIHPNLESLYGKVPKTHLPSDYGGSLPNVDSMLKKWDLVLKEQDDLYDKISKLASTPLADQDYDGIFGAQGTFKTLNLD